MSNSLDYIDRYFNEELTHEERDAFKKQCLNDPAFAKEVAFYIMVNDYLKEQWSEQKRKEFAELEVDPLVDPAVFSLNGNPLTDGTYGEQKEEQQERENREMQDRVDRTGKEEPAIWSLRSETFKSDGKVRRVRIWKSLAIAAAILGIIALSITWYLNKDAALVAVNGNKADSLKNKNIPDTISSPQSKPSNPIVKVEKPATNAVRNKRKYSVDNAKRETLFAANFRPDIVPEDKPATLEDAFVHYESGDYKGAIAAINGNADLVFRDDDDQDKDKTTFYAHYYIAQSYLADNNPAKAIPALEKAIAESPDEVLKTKTQWYLALAYLKTGSLKRSEKLLRQIAKGNQEAGYKSKAGLLLKKLRK